MRGSSWRVTCEGGDVPSELDGITAFEAFKKVGEEVRTMGPDYESSVKRSP
jgi:hypothetical protein